MIAADINHENRRVSVSSLRMRTTPWLGENKHLDKKGILRGFEAVS
jgi:hypothetical protein